MSCLNITREKKKKLNKNNLIALNFFFFYQKWLKGETTMQYIKSCACNCANILTVFFKGRTPLKKNIC